MSFEDAVGRHRSMFEQILEVTDQVEALAVDLVTAFHAGNKVLLMGNGGSAADCQHIAAEFVVRYKDERRPLPAIALTVDTSVLTAHSNDYDYATVFERQALAHTRPGDVIIGLTTSGNSPNIINALEAVSDHGCARWAMTNATGGKVATMEGIKTIRVPSTETARVQEGQMFIAHWLCEEVDRQLLTTP